MSDLNLVFLFCAAYSGVVVFSLWMTVADKNERLQKVRKSF